LAAFGREPSNPATVSSNGATDGGSHDPNWIELPVLAKHSRNRSQERHRRAQCLKNPVPEAAGTGLQDFWMGSSEPMIPIEENTEFRWPQMIIYFSSAGAKKLIPVKNSCRLNPKTADLKIHATRSRRTEIKPCVLSKFSNFQEMNVVAASRAGERIALWKGLRKRGGWVFAKFVAGTAFTLHLENSRPYSFDWA
jgi:hypothetical protein